MERILIGTNEQDGLPISAPIITEESCNATCKTCGPPINRLIPRMRWRKHNLTISLEYYHAGKGQWIEVPFVS